MKWEEVLTLLSVVGEVRDYPKLKGIRDRAIAELEAVDADALHFASQVDHEGVEDE